MQRPFLFLSAWVSDPSRPQLFPFLENDVELCFGTKFDEDGCSPFLSNSLFPLVQSRCFFPGSNIVLRFLLTPFPWVGLVINPLFFRWRKMTIVCRENLLYLSLRSIFPALSSLAFFLFLPQFAAWSLACRRLLLPLPSPFWIPFTHSCTFAEGFFFFFGGGVEKVCKARGRMSDVF